MKHSIDKDKYRKALEQRGWYVDSVYRVWIPPSSKTMKQITDDQEQATIEAIICEPDTTT